VQQLTQTDAVFLYSESPRVPMHIGSLHVYDPSTAPDGPPPFEEILAQVRRRLPLSKVLRRKLVRVPFDVDYPYWVEDADFDVEFHVRNIALPEPGNWDQLWVQASRLHSQPLDLRRPPWELYVIEGLESVEGFPPGCFGVMIKVHHSAIDGLSGIELMNSLHDLTPDGREAPVDSWRPETEPGPWQLLRRAGGSLAVTPTRGLRLLWRTLPNLRPSSVADTARRPRRGQRTVLNAPATTHRVAQGFRFELATAKAIRAAVPGATVNDVVLAVVAGGLRSYLRARDELPDTSLSAGVPVSTRPEGEAPGGGNKIAMMVVPLATDVADPLDRLKAIQQATSTSKEQMNGVPARALAEGAELLPGALIGIAMRTLPRLGGRGTASALGNVCVTNVPGSQVPLYLCGARMEAYYGLGPVFDYAGPIHLIVSYLGEIHLSFCSAREIVPDPAFYVDCQREALAELIAATGAAAAPAAPKARSTATPGRSRARTTSKKATGARRAR
jgi:diacylglycerol O-acyltransferase / wax synthase